MIAIQATINIQVVSLPIIKLGIPNLSSFYHLQYFIFYFDNVDNLILKIMIFKVNIFNTILISLNWVTNWVLKYDVEKKS